MFDENGLCHACRWYEQKKTAIDWTARRAELQKICNEARAAADGPYHCVLGVSGGKDSTWQALYLRDEMGINPLLVQFACSDGTDLPGRRNLEKFGGTGLHAHQPSAQSPCSAWLLSRKSFFEYGNIIKYSEHALYATPFRVAIDYKIPIVFFGENPALEAGDRNIGRPGWDATAIQYNNTLGGQGIEIWTGDGITERDLAAPMPFRRRRRWRQVGRAAASIMGYFLDWSVWENAVFSLKHGFECINEPHRDIGIPYLHNSLRPAIMAASSMPCSSTSKLGVSGILPKIHQL